MWDGCRVHQETKLKKKKTKNKKTKRNNKKERKKSVYMYKNSNEANAMCYLCNS